MSCEQWRMCGQNAKIRCNCGGEHCATYSRYHVQRHAREVYRLKKMKENEIMKPRTVKVSRENANQRKEAPGLTPNPLWKNSQEK